MISLFPVPSLMNSLIFTISILFFTSKTLLTKKLSLPLPFFQFFRKQLKTTHNFGHFSLQLKKKKETRDRQSFLARFAWVLLFRDSLSVSLSRWLVDWSNARLVVRLFSIDCQAIGNWFMGEWGDWGKGGLHLPVAKTVPINKFAPFWKTNRWLIEQPSDPYRLSQRLVAMLAAFVGCLWSWL